MSIKAAVGWTCSILVALQVVAGILAVVALKVGDVPDNLRGLAGPSPWFSLGLSAGTGVFVDDSGDVLTNSHVIAGCRRVTIAGDGLRGVRASLVARLDDNFQDLALLHVDRTPRMWLAFEDQPAPEETPGFSFTVPSPIVLLGFPGRMDGVVPHQEPVSNIKLWRPTGDTSPKHWLLNVIATVQAGNSGSPVIDGRGLLVGLITTGTFADRRSHVTNLTGESGDAVYGRYISDWLHDVGISVSVQPPNHSSRSIDTISPAVVRVFCFGQHDIRDISVGSTRGAM